MLKKWEKIEEVLNVLLGKVKLFFISLFFKIIPKKWIELFKLYKAKLIEYAKAQITKTIAWYQTQKDQKEERKEKFKQFMARSKEEFAQIAAKIKSLKEVKPRIPTKADFKIMWAAIKEFPTYFWKVFWFVKEDQRTFAITVVAILLPGLLLLGYMSKELMYKSGFLREPAAVIREFQDPRPKYYHQYDRTMKVHSVNFPVYVESVRGARMLRMDLTVTTSNKYTRNYLHGHFHLVQDRLNSRLEPMVPEFPIEEEGKKIIKAKVREELDSLIKELKIDGKVQSVHIHSILSG